MFWKVMLPEKNPKITINRRNKPFFTDSKSGRRQRLVGSNPTHSAIPKPSKIKGFGIFYCPKITQTFVWEYGGISGFIVTHVTRKITRK